MTTPNACLSREDIPPYGFVELISVNGNDATIANSARTSYADGTKKSSGDETLIRYLLSHSHWTPFEMCSVLVRIRAPIPIVVQLLRHRSMSFNQESARYSITKDEMWRPTEDNPLRRQSVGQTSTSEDSQQWLNEAMVLWNKSAELNQMIYENYIDMIEHGIAREQARFTLPQSMYSTIVIHCNIRSLLTFLSLRDDSHAQLEIQAIAKSMDAQIRPYFPFAFSAYNNYMKGGLVLSATELAGKVSNMSAREKSEFETKLSQLRKLVERNDRQG